MNSLRESTNNGREIEDMIGRISFSGDDLSAPSDEEIGEEQEEEQDHLAEEDADNESSSNEYVHEGKKFFILFETQRSGLGRVRDSTQLRTSAK